LKKSPATESDGQASALLLVNIRQLLTLRGDPGPRRGRSLEELGILEEGAVLCAAGKVVAVGTTRDAVRDHWFRRNRARVTVIDCAGRVVLPGFVDSHTHPVFVAPRLLDFEKRISGASYQEIAAAGGGIRSSISGVRAATRKRLSQNVLHALRDMASLGTTTVEAKSGYGLSFEAELKSLEAIRDAARQWPGTVVATLLGAHVVPPEFINRRPEYLDVICRHMVPTAAKRKLAQYVDVFCEQGAFTPEETVHVFQAAQQHGLGTRAHVCQLTPCSLAGLSPYDPASFDHMGLVQDEDIAELARRDTVATLLPGAEYFLNLPQYAPARKLLDAGVAVALATDYNPGTSPTTSMPFVLSLACTHMRMTAAEAIAAATINGACALRLQGRKGSIEPGKDADLAIFEVEDYREIPYWFGTNRCAGVIAHGKMV
jgi:imidazolonepropionase